MFLPDFNELADGWLVPSFGEETVVVNRVENSIFV